MEPQDGETRAVVGAVVLMVTVAGVPGLTELGAIEHCGANEGSGETEQEREAELLNPFTELTFTVAVDDCPAMTGLGVSEDPDSANMGNSAATLRSTLAE